VVCQHKLKILDMLPSLPSSLVAAPAQRLSAKFTLLLATIFSCRFKAFPNVFAADMLMDYSGSLQPATSPHALIELSAIQQIVYYCWAMQNLHVRCLLLSISELPQEHQRPYLEICLSLALVQIMNGTGLPPLFTYMRTYLLSASAGLLMVLI